jgi:hypothetical protein
MVRLKITDMELQDLEVAQKEIYTSLLPSTITLLKRDKENLYATVLDLYSKHFRRRHNVDILMDR